MKQQIKDRSPFVITLAFIVAFFLILQLGIENRAYETQLESAHRTINSEETSLSSLQNCFWTERAKVNHAWHIFNDMNLVSKEQTDKAIKAFRASKDNNPCLNKLTGE